MRNVTNQLIEALEEGLVSYETVAAACLSFMSEDEIRTMVSNEELLPNYDDE